MSVQIRAARRGDEAAILGLVRGLAEYEKLLDAVETTETQLADALFADAPRVFCDLAEQDGRPIGLAVWFYNFSTFRGRHGIYLEDLFVEPGHRGRGVGKRMLVNLACRCVDEGLGRLDWSVLGWNAPAIAFYRGQGAQLLDDWRICRLTGPALAAMGKRKRSG